MRDAFDVGRDGGRAGGMDLTSQGGEKSSRVG